jgi:hypothetical protein
MCQAPERPYLNAPPHLSEWQTILQGPAFVPCNDLLVTLVPMLSAQETAL